MWEADLQLLIEILYIYFGCHTVDVVFRFYNFVQMVAFIQYYTLPLYNTIQYNTVLDITRISVGPQMIIKD